MQWAKRVWHFLWHEDSIASWLANLALAFVLVKFVIYPGIGLLFGTDFPPGGTSRVVAEALASLRMFDERAMRAIDRDNAVRLLPRLQASFQ